MDDRAQEAILLDRLSVIERVMYERGEENFAMSWSGGRDSCVMSALFDMAIPGNRIPRVYADTGLDLTIMRKFVVEQSKTDDRIVIIKPSVNIMDMLRQEGYPFASKLHSRMVDRYQRLGKDGSQSVRRYLGEHEDGRTWSSRYSCPKCLRYQFEDGFDLKVSMNCCVRMKEEPLDNWAKEHGYKYNIIGLMADEGGARQNSGCFSFSHGELRAFQPLAPLTKEWERWFIDKYNVTICDVYKPPYNNTRTGCKGCPFSKFLQKELDMLEEYFPNDRKQCEKLWGPVYAEYRRLGYRLRKEV